MTLPGPRHNDASNVAPGLGCPSTRRQSPTLRGRGRSDAQLTFVSHGPLLNHMVQYTPAIDQGFSALSDPTRRGVLERLSRGPASITDLATVYGMTLTGMKKHVSVLEEAGLVTTEKIGRVRSCRLGPRRLEAERDWIEAYRQLVTDRLNRLGDLLERTRE